jgi:predicted ATP-dependent protease
LYTQGKRIGGSCDLVIFLKPKSGEREPQIKSNIDHNNPQNTVINFSVEVAPKDKEGYKNLIRNSLIEKKINCDAFVLVRLDGSMSGPSAGIGFYLVLHSLLHQIPLPKNLGSTGTIEGQRVGAIGGLNLKLEYSVRKEKPINIFILSIENKKYRGVPSQSYEDLFSYITERVKQVHFVSSIKEIEIALNEILNETIKDKVHVCGDGVRDKRQKEPQSKNMEIQATPEQFLALITDNMIGRREIKKIDEKTHEAGHTIPDPQLKEIYQITLKDPQFSEVINESKILYSEYKQKIDSNSAEE